jgi:hypothetical protein
MMERRMAIDMEWAMPEIIWDRAGRIGAVE